MKKTAFLLVLASLLMTSCLKDGFKDFDALRHGMTINGTVSPTFGVPIGTGSATIYDMLKMVQISYAEMEVDDRGIITIAYDTTNSFHISLEDNGKGSGSKDADIVHIARSEIAGSVAVDLFDNLTILDTVDIEVDSLLVDLKAFVIADADENALQALENYHVHVYYDSLSISVLGQDNKFYDIYPGPNDPKDSIPIEDLIRGETITLFNGTDISLAINKRPKEVHYSARMNIAFEAEFFASGMSENQFVADSIGVKAIDIDADIKVRFPLSAYLNDLHYETDIAFAPSFHLDDLVIDSSMIYLECQNGLPLALSVRAQLIDDNGQVMCDILDPVLTEVAGADVALNPASNLYTATGPKQTVVQVPITKEVFNSLLNTRGLRLSAGLSTSSTGNPARNRVSIQASDLLQLRVWAKLHPTYDINIDIHNNDNGEGGAE